MLKLNLIKTTGYDEPRLLKLRGALAPVENILNSQQFKDAVLNFTTNGELTFSFKKNWFKSFDTYTNEEVYKMIMQAHELHDNIMDGSVDLYLDLKEGSDGNVVGYGLPGDEIIHTYKEWFDNPDRKNQEIANHIIHEWCHKIGFEHAQQPWQDINRNNSVPYAIGNLVEGFYNNLNLTLIQ